MKFNKKIAVPFLSTAMGLSLIGGVGGAVAWYQYNSRVTASFIGTSVADTSVLQIGTKASESDPIVWGRDVVSGTENDNKLAPVTFGKLLTNDVLPEKAYAYPEAGKGDYTTGWQVAAVGKEYVQFTVYLRAMVPDATKQDGYVQGVKDVYLSEVVLEDATTGKSVQDALRVHLGFENNEGTNRLISKTAVSNLALSGKLDLDQDGVDDKTGGYAWEQGRDTDVIYGINGDTQTTLGISDIVQARDTDGYMPRTANDKLICQTKANGETKIVITVWLEGWHQLGATGSESNIWNPNKTAAASVHVGLKFDIGRQN